MYSANAARLGFRLGQEGFTLRKTESLEWEITEKGIFALAIAKDQIFTWHEITLN